MGIHHENIRKLIINGVQTDIPGSRLFPEEPGSVPHRCQKCGTLGRPRPHANTGACDIRGFLPVPGCWAMPVEIECKFGTGEWAELTGMQPVWKAMCERTFVPHYVAHARREADIERVVMEAREWALKLWREACDESGRRAAARASGG